METYNPTKSPDAETWLDLDESDRLAMIEEYVILSEKKINSEVVTTHASAHLIVENQLALGEKPAIQAYSRLIQQGLRRHDVVHAIGAVMVEHMYSMLHENEPVNAYKNRLRKLTAKKWLKGKY